MKIHKSAMAGILESNGCQITVKSGEGNIEFAFESAVINQYGNRIKRVVMETLENLSVKDVRIAIVNKDAPDYIIRVRVEDAVFRATGRYDNLPQGGVIR